MDNFGLVETIRDYCTANSIIFVYGNEAYHNAVCAWQTATGNSLVADQLVLFCGFEYIPNMVNGRIVEITYNGFLNLGRHAEDTTSSSLDETPEQKYDRRLKSLYTRLGTLIGDIGCTNELSVVGTVTMNEVYNSYDENIDTVGTTITWLK